MTAISDLTGVGPALAKLLKEGGFKRLRMWLLPLLLI